ncbi:hypothetical protein Taro_019333 [Colocasia esculenta]|uniref:Uncharacterized protein n=1 Tax=Colocasia esculenta TaxID=4460 RepID=A0A843V1W4_COLES|nr:hypothetical protein [Colocasia esculenta]
MASVVARRVRAVVVRLAADSLTVCPARSMLLLGLSRYSVCRVASLVEHCDTCIAWLPCVLGLRYAVVLAGVFWWVFPELCLGGSGGVRSGEGPSQDRPLSFLAEVLPRSALCSFDVCGSTVCSCLSVSVLCRLESWCIVLYLGWLLVLVIAPCVVPCALIMSFVALSVVRLALIVACVQVFPLALGANVFSCVVGMLVPALNSVCVWRVCYQLFVGSVVVRGVGEYAASPSFAPGSPSAAALALTWIASSASYLNILIARAPSACTTPLSAQAVQLAASIAAHGIHHICFQLSTASVGFSSRLGSKPAKCTSRCARDVQHRQPLGPGPASTPARTHGHWLLPSSHAAHASFRSIASSHHRLPELYSRHLSQLQQLQLPDPPCPTPHAAALLQHTS